MEQMEIVVAAIDGGDGTASIKIFEDRKAAAIQNYINYEKHGESEFDVESITVAFNGEAVLQETVITSRDLILDELDPDNEDDVDFLESIGLEFPET